MPNRESVLSRRRLLYAMGALGAGSAASVITPGAAQAAPKSGTTAAELYLPSPPNDAVVPMRLHVPESMLRDLRQRLEMTRWPAEELVDDWSQGAPLRRVKHLVEYWKRHYDWRRVESLLNSFGQYRTVIDGVSIHLLHAKSPHAEAMPIMLTHGWPGSVLEFRNVIRRLTHPTEFGGSRRDAFHVVVPSLPGFGFSDQPDDLGWGRARTAKAWAEIMPRLGYDHYLSQGGDWGAAVNAQLGVLRPKGLLGIHLNFPQIVPPDLDLDHLTPEEQVAMDQLNRQQQNEIGYQLEMMTRPQTVSYSLADSPVGQAAWIYEKFGVWSDSNKNPESIWTLDEMLDDITLYWLTNSAESAARFYWENSDVTMNAVEIDIPMGVTLFPKEFYTPPRAWAERAFSKLVYWNQASKGGHFAAFEQPVIFAEEMRKFGRLFRGA
ncbi:epoxide hydrolase family protein [Streptomyces sp. NPDC018026]|uniref:epoxide hydrolase family protein n=1 Tax=Streptomyces sp. NPDC018026 TaxID=3365031 RepID=UPI00378C09BD